MNFNFIRLILGHSFWTHPQPKPTHNPSPPATQAHPQPQFNLKPLHWIVWIGYFGTENNIGLYELYECMNVCIVWIVNNEGFLLPNLNIVLTT